MTGGVPFPSNAHGSGSTLQPDCRALGAGMGNKIGAAATFVWRVSGGAFQRAHVRAQISLLAVVAAVAAFVGLDTLAADGPPDQWTWTIHATTAAVTKPIGMMLDTRDVGLLWWDLALIVVYLIAAFALHADTIRRAGRIYALGEGRFRPLQARLQRWSLAGCTYIVLAALADLVEDALVWWLSTTCDPHIAKESCESVGGWLTALQVATWVKLLAFGVGVVALGLASLSSLVRSRDLRMPRDDGADVVEDRGWVAGRHQDPSAFRPQIGRRGVCLSGGGIRSASFSLGALQAVAESDLDRIRYVTSASGGGYMAAAWASLSGARTAERRPFEPRSPEERWVRHHTDYLVSSMGSLIGAGLSVVTGLVINVVIVVGILLMAAHPLGWVVGAAHPEQRAELPILEVAEQSSLEVGRVVPADAAQIAIATKQCDCTEGGTSGPGYEVFLVAEGGRSPVALDIRISQAVDQPVRDLQPPPTLGITPALVAETEEGLVVLRQPIATIEPGYLQSQRYEPVLEHLEVDRQPTIATTTGSALAAGPMAGARPVEEQVQDLVSVDGQPHVRQTTGTLGRDALAFPAWMWWVVVAILLAAIVAWVLDRRLLRFQGEETHLPVQALAKLAAGAAALLLVVPFLSRNLPTWLSRFPGYDPTGTRWQAVFGFAVVAVPAIARLRGWFATQVGKMKAFRGAGLLLDLFLGLVVIGTVLTTFLLLVDLAAANGPSGRLEGVHDSWMFSWTDTQRWAVGLLVPLAIVIVPVSSHAWSLYTFYRGRLAVSYFLQRAADSQSGRIRPMASKDQRAWAWRDRTVDEGRAVRWLVQSWMAPPGEASPAAMGAPTIEIGPGLGALSGPTEGPQADLDAIEEWVVCTTANIRGAGEAAPGRNAGSFTFSRSWVGGPEVGWMPTRIYLDRLHEGRQRDVSVPSTVTISGAAFSPAMGKASKSWQGRVFALINLRLGVWVPNPMLVRRRLDGDVGRVRRPNALWYVRELLGWFDRTAPYVYLTDGGHWDNLGLVEVLRRGCTDVWMVSAAGDGTSSFETMAQAMALAREELGVEFDLELEPLRAPAKPPEKAKRQLLRRKKGADEDSPTAPASFVEGTYRFPPNGQGVRRRGTIHVIEATVTRDLPWDVHGYAEKNADFPDVSTGYQLMDHRDFEAYRMAGYVQTARALAKAGHWPNPNDEFLLKPVEEEPPDLPHVVVHEA